MGLMLLLCMTFAMLYRFYTHCVLQDRKLAPSGTIPGEDFSYSDNEGLETTFLLEERDTAISVPQRISDGERAQINRQCRCL